MVTLADTIQDRITVDTSKHIGRKGFINGNWGEFYVVWKKVASGDAMYPGEPVIRSSGDGGGDEIADATANHELGYGVVEWDPNQIANAATEYSAGDLVPVLPWHGNPGMIFQGWVLDTNGNKAADTGYDYGNAGFDVADYANRMYAQQMYYVADTDATPQHLILYAIGGHGG